MEGVRIAEFLAVDNGDGDGDGDGSGYGYGCNSGDGSGDGSGWGDGDGSGYGSGSGSSSGIGYRSGLKSINGKSIHIIDGIPTIIDRITMGVAKGHILGGDLTLTPCWVMKQGNVFAHGATLHEARDALMDKLFEDMPEEERIEAFVEAHENGKVYADKDFLDWHHRLTGSCEAGRMAFAKNHGLGDLQGSRTVREFIALCEHSYGGETIRKLWEYYPGGAEKEGL